MRDPMVQVWPDDDTAYHALIEDARRMLGEGMIAVELGPEHWETAFRLALDRYRTRSDNAFEESFIFLTVQPDVQEYRLPDEIETVRGLYRRGASGNTPGGTFFDPFAAAFINAIYALPYATGAGDLATYDFARQYQELVGRMFGRDVIYTWRKADHTLVLHRKFAAPEPILLHAYNMRPIAALLSDHAARQWLRDATVAYAKLILAEARGLYSSVPGPAGDVSLNADALRSDAQASLERLENELRDYVDGVEDVYTFAIG